MIRVDTETNETNILINCYEISSSRNTFSIWVISTDSSTFQMLAKGQICAYKPKIISEESRKPSNHILMAESLFENIRIS
jgi:hypothetical protein